MAGRTPMLMLSGCGTEHRLTAALPETGADLPPVFGQEICAFRVNIVRFERGTRCNGREKRIQVVVRGTLLYGSSLT